MGTEMSSAVYVVPPHGSSQWCLLRVSPGQEKLSQAFFEVLGRTSYFPLVTIKTFNRRQRRGSWRRVPAFPGYVFVEGEYSPNLGRFSGCMGPVRVGGDVIFISNDVIEDIRIRFETLEVQEKDWKKPVKVQVGETLKTVIPLKEKEGRLFFKTDFELGTLNFILDAVEVREAERAGVAIEIV